MRQAVCSPESYVLGTRTGTRLQNSPRTTPLRPNSPSRNQALQKGMGGIWPTATNNALMHRSSAHIDMCHYNATHLPCGRHGLPRLRLRL